MGFTEARATASRVMSAQRKQAARTVAHHSLDARDRRELLSMLDLPDPAPGAAAQQDGTHEPAPGTTSNTARRDVPGVSRPTEGARA